MKIKPTKQRCLLATMTNEPFQPVRLYYTIPDKSFVVRKLKKRDCMVEAPHERCWQWLYHGDAASLRFAAGGYDDVPEHRRPIVLGRIRFPKQSSMTLQTNSIERAIAGARFFASRLGTEVLAIRCRVVNRCFAADEGQPDKLMATLDQDVTVVDPRLGPDARHLARPIQPKRMFRDPYPFSEDCFLAADEKGIWVLDGQGDTELVYSLPADDAWLSCH